MLEIVETEGKSLNDYIDIIGKEEIESIKKLALPLKGKKVVHINATSFGGGVAEILFTLVPLMKDVGIEAEWQVIKGSDNFFNVTKSIHNGLQGMDVSFTKEMKEIFLKNNQLNEKLFEGEYDFVIIHDPQPVAILNYRQEKKGKWIWRFHIDPTSAQEKIWRFIRSFIEKHDAAIFTLKEYVKDDLKLKNIAIIPPAIDPLSPKNMDLDQEEIENIVTRYKVDPNRPIITQVSRFDPWKDPLGVIDMYRIVKREVKDVQLVLIASMANDDPEGWEYYEKTARHAGEDYDIHLLSNLNGVGNLEVNAFQRASDVIIQKSLREGFGLVITEALWKGKPVVAANVGGIPLQVDNRRTGFLVGDISECAERVIHLLKNTEIANKMGTSGKEYVRKNFLITRLLKDYLSLFNSF
ncbi:MAG TPA: glycosyl transferase family 1 [Candidatus Atribacteria bacterium]|jgi:trehalose synthase|nr:glycosyl transferase family 1 [Candidatus Atribacteria bacterium]